MCKFIPICKSRKLGAQKSQKKIYLCTLHYTSHTVSVYYTTRGMNFRFGRPNRFGFSRLCGFALYNTNIVHTECTQSEQVQEHIMFGWLGCNDCIPQINVLHFIHIHFIISIFLCVCVALHVLVLLFS